MITIAEKRLCRILTGERTSTPVKVIEGDSSPKVKGTGFYFTNKSGGIIYHPSSYNWPMVYHKSTYRIEVGAEWLKRNRKAVSICEDKRCLGHIEEKRLKKLTKVD